MTHFTPKKYQQDPANGGGVLDSVEAYFKACHQHGRASRAFTVSEWRSHLAAMRNC